MLDVHRRSISVDYDAGKSLICGGTVEHHFAFVGLWCCMSGAAVQDDSWLFLRGYIPDCHRCTGYISGYTGSAGYKEETCDGEVEISG